MKMSLSWMEGYSHLFRKTRLFLISYFFSEMVPYRWWHLLCSRWDCRYERVKQPNRTTRQWKHNDLQTCQLYLLTIKYKSPMHFRSYNLPIFYKHFLINITCILIQSLLPDSNPYMSFWLVPTHRPVQMISWLLPPLTKGIPIFPSKSNIHVLKAIFGLPCLYLLLHFSPSFSTCTNLPYFSNKHGLVDSK